MNSHTAAPKLNDPKIVRAWTMYDWANSVYSLVIVTAIFPIYYKAVAVENGSDVITFLGFQIQNSNLYSYALSVSFLIVALMLPLLSGAADYTGNKKIFMKAFAWTGSLACMGLFFFEGIDTLWLAILLSIIASVGYSGSLVFYDAFLPEIVTPDRYDATSAKGYSMGYYGSVLLMIVCLVLILGHETFGIGSGLASRISFVLVGLWWMGFTIIPLRKLPDNPYNRRPEGNTWSNGYKEIAKVWGSLSDQPDLKKFLVAFFFWNMGVQTVMYLATLFGTDVLQLKDDTLIPTVVAIQLLGAVGAWAFSRLSMRRGNRYALMTMIFIWIGICITAYFITTAVHFYIIAAVVGLVMGGIQSLSRATYSKLIPETTIDHASYFSFYDVAYNLSIVFGTFSYGLINQLTGSMRNSALALGIYFVIGMILLLAVKSPNVLGKKNEIEEEVTSTEDVLQ
jgi:MFS transporter, UMF1 family